MQPALIGSTMRALSTASVHDEFVDSWKDHIKEKVSEYNSELFTLQKDKVLDRGIS